MDYSKSGGVKHDLMTKTPKQKQKEHNTKKVKHLILRGYSVNTLHVALQYITSVTNIRTKFTRICSSLGALI